MKVKKNFIYYGIIWLIALVVFNVIVFVAPMEKVGVFWAGYILITIMFLIQIACSYFTINQDSLDKVFLNIPIMVISYSALATSLVFGSLFMAVQNLPNWIAVIGCTVITAFYVIAIVAGKSASETIGNIDKKIKTQTFFIKSLTIDAQTLMAKAESDKAKELTKKVYEAVRYSDPMSNDALAQSETSITIKFKEFEDSVISNNESSAEIFAKELLILINDRNQKCKLLK